MSYSFNADLSALELLESITKGLDFSIGDVDLDDPGYAFPQELLDLLQNTPDKISTEDLTERKINGSGVFDAIMMANKVHLWEEYDAGRIQGAEYAKAYTALCEASMTNAVNFLINKDKAFWDAVSSYGNMFLLNTQIANARVQLAIAKAQALLHKAEYALNVCKLATEDAQYALVKEQYESARGATLDVRSDGQTIVGSLGRTNTKTETESEVNRMQLQVYDAQIRLYNQQIISYQRDAETKAAKLFTEPWITQKSIDEGLTAPTALQNDSVNTVLQTIKKNNSLE